VVPLAFLRASYLGFCLPWPIPLLQNPLCRHGRSLSDWPWLGLLAYLLSVRFPAASQQSGGLGRGGQKMFGFFPFHKYSSATKHPFLIRWHQDHFKALLPKKPRGWGAGAQVHGCLLVHSRVCRVQLGVQGPWHDRRVLELER